MERSAVRKNGLKWMLNGAIAGGVTFGMWAASPGAAATAFAQSVEDAFASNIHRYYSGEFDQLIAELSGIVNEDLEDPRIYYLRGLAFLKTGQQEMAAEDLKKGAELEALQYGKRNYSIARTMQRVQGNDRAMLEAARSEAMQRRSELRSAKAGIPRAQILAEMGRSILDPPAVPTARPNLPDPSTLVDDTAPFGDEWETAPKPRPTLQAPVARPNAGGDVDSDPFDAPESTPTRDPKNERATNDPFSGDADPFGAPAPTRSIPPARNTDPFEQDATGNDPFSQPGKTAPEPSNDPFAGSPANLGNQAGSVAPADPGKVDGGKVLGKFFGALTSPLRRAAEQGANAMQNIPGVGMVPGTTPPPAEFDLNSSDPFDNR